MAKPKARHNLKTGAVPRAEEATDLKAMRERHQVFGVGMVRTARYMNRRDLPAEKRRQESEHP
jgi:hypothetical protein